MAILSDHGDDIDLDRALIIFRTTVDDRAMGRAVERLLGDLAAEERLDLLDGRILAWPPESPGWRHRAPYNVPLLAPLPAAVWDPVAPDGRGARPGPELALLMPEFAPGTIALCAICPERTSRTFGAALQRINPALRMTTISTGRYRQLRREAKSRRSGSPHPMTGPDAREI